MAAALAAGAVGYQCAHAQIRTDGSLGRGAQSLPGPNYILPESLGRLSGNNLFHSFSVFNINSGESATFTTTTLGIANVISRVTGGSPSLINGPLSLVAASGAPNFFFINPAGVMFGSGASIDVPGAFHVSTADYIKFADGKFFADASAASTLSSAPPEAFGFLGTNRGTVAVRDGATLSTNLLQPFSIIAGDVEIDGGNVTTNSGDIRIVALGQRSQEVSLAGPLPAADGRLAILNGGYIFAPSIGAHDGGNVAVSAGGITIDGRANADATGIFTSAVFTTGNAGSIEITATGNISIANGGQISSNTFRSGNAGSVKVNAGSILIDPQNSGLPTGILSEEGGSNGAAGSVEVTVTGNLSIAAGGKISSETISTGDAAPVKVSAGSINMDALGTDLLTGILSQAVPGSSGAAGPVEVTVAGNLSIAGGSQISSNTSSMGNAGSVKVSAGSIAIDATGSDFRSGIFSDASVGSSGDAGAVEVTAAGSLSIINGGQISSDTYSKGNAGSVKVRAASITIDDLGSDLSAAITSDANDGSAGNAGNVEVTATGSLSVLNTAFISSDTYSTGNAGSVKVSAASITIDGKGGGDFFTGISSETGAAGNAGNIVVTATGNISIVNGGQISSDTYSKGNAGSVKVSAGSITIDGRTSGDFFVGISSDANTGSTGNAGALEVTVAGNLSILGGSQISSDTYSSGNAGSIKVNAGSITIDGTASRGFVTGISSDARTGSRGRAGDVEVTATGDLSIVNGGTISSNTSSPGNAGSVKVSAGSLSIAKGGLIFSDTFSAGDAGSVAVSAGSIAVDGGGSPRFTGISSQAEPGSSGRAGDILLTVTGGMSIVNGGEISSSTFSAGNAGAIRVTAGSIDINSQGFNLFGTGIFTGAFGTSTGNAGTIDVTAARSLSVVNGGVISSSTISSGNAGSVKVGAGSITIDRQNSDRGTGVFSEAGTGSAGNAGTVELTAAGTLSIANGGEISSSTSSVGNAGSVKVSAGSIDIDGQGFSKFGTGIFSQAYASSGGNAGDVGVTVTGGLSIVNGGEISSSTLSLGNAGSVKVDAGSITIDRQGSAKDTGVFSRAESGSTGNAGSVAVSATDNLSLLNGGVISSSTASAGNAGSVAVTAGTLLVDGRYDASHPSSINAAAEAGSSGQTGSVVVKGTSAITLSNGGELSITNFARVAAPGSILPTLLTVSAPQISLSSGGQITAASYENVAASDIRVDFGTRLSLSNSAITTSARDGNGGSIQINGDGVLTLQDAQITTSVSGLSGNGGDINVKASALVMDTGFIQANTAASNATGGNVTIDVQTLVPSGNSLFVGGQEPFIFQPGVFGLNVIQAAAPTGVSGTIEITTPALDVAAGLSGLNTKVIDTGGLGRSLCQTTGGSSLAQTGRGGLPPSARDLLRVESASPPNASGRTPTNSTSAYPYLSSSRAGCPG